MFFVYNSGITYNIPNIGNVNDHLYLQSIIRFKCRGCALSCALGCALSCALTSPADLNLLIMEENELCEDTKVSNSILRNTEEKMENLKGKDLAVCAVSCSLLNKR